MIVNGEDNDGNDDNECEMSGDPVTASLTSNNNKSEHSNNGASLNNSNNSISSVGGNKEELGASIGGSTEPSKKNVLVSPASNLRTIFPKHNGMSSHLMDALTNVSNGSNSGCCNSNRNKQPIDSNNNNPAGECSINEKIVEKIFFANFYFTLVFNLKIQGF